MARFAETSWIWSNGEFVRWASATVHTLVPTMHYGWGVFEGIRCYDTPRGRVIFRLSDHMARLRRSAEILGSPLPYDEKTLSEAAKQTILKNEVRTAYIRPIAYPAYGEIGLDPTGWKMEVAIAVWPWEAYLGSAASQSGCELITSSWERLSSRAVPTGAKVSGFYVNSSLAKAEATRAGYDEALLLGEHGRVVEASGMNLFVVDGSVVRTPPVSDGALPGIRRASAITLARALGYEVVEESLLREDVYSADEAFLTGTAAELVPVHSLDGRTLSRVPGPITQEVQVAFEQVLNGEEQGYREWLEDVD